MRCLAALAEGSPTSAQPLVHLKLNFMSETSLETNHNLSSRKAKAAQRHPTHARHATRTHVHVHVRRESFRLSARSNKASATAGEPVWEQNRQSGNGFWMTSALQCA